jgi:pimeloyl-ACP methyl ester carboxylesterase
MRPEHRFLTANGVRFHYVTQGRGELVLLLHGFPECWYSWRHQVPSLAAAGYRVVAPDMRGYNLTDKPRGGYNIESLVDDVVAIAHELGEERAHVAGHDWGGIVAWQTAWRHPEFVRSLAVLNAPHPTAFARYVRRSPRQMLNSTYVLFFQVPRLPERLLTRRGASAIPSAFRRSAVRPDAFTDADLEVFRQAMLRPGAARATLAYYRQAVRQGPAVLPDSPITVPTLVLWGTGDPILRQESNRALEAWVTDLEFKAIEDCGHWTQQEQPETVNRELLAWLGRHSAATTAEAAPGAARL